jgi:hypothetical protein
MTPLSGTNFGRNVIKPLCYLSAKDIGEFESRDMLGEQDWKRMKQQLDDLLAYRKTIKGAPTDAQRIILDGNRLIIDSLSSSLFHSFFLQRNGDRCVCKGCADKRNTR